ncbi:MAG: GntR family transcriptional regulator [Coriobacteriales bacterium]
MLLTVNLASETPIYLQIRQQLVEAIAAEELREGDKLPSVRQLASDLGVNMHTVNKAYAVLRDEGFLLMNKRTGAVVAPKLRLSGQGVDECGSDERLAPVCGELQRLALEFKAAGGSAALFRQQFEKAVAEVFASDNKPEGEC